MRLDFRRSRLGATAGAALAIACALWAPPSRAGSGTFGPLELANLRGEQVSLEDLRGQVVVLNFWASWCRPCLDEMPALAKLSERYQRRGVKVVAASIDDPDNRSAVELLARHLPAPMEVWVGATVADMLRLQLGDSLPVTVLIDQDGYVTHVHHGVVAEHSFDDTLRRLLDDDRDDAKGLTTVGLPACQAEGRSL